MADSAQIRFSLFDRLIDEQPSEGRDAPRAAPQQLAMIRNSVRRDLQALLNTRRRPLPPHERLAAELSASLVGYGLPDLHTMGAGGQYRDQLRRIIEDTVSRFLPVFSSLEVTPLDNLDPLDRALRFRISALLHLEIEDQPIVFDSVLDPASRQFTVRSSDSV
jgi:type VI secretion system protein ImpF